MGSTSSDNSVGFRMALFRVGVGRGRLFAKKCTPLAKRPLSLFLLGKRTHNISLKMGEEDPEIEPPGMHSFARNESIFTQEKYENLQIFVLRVPVGVLTKRIRALPLKSRHFHCARRR